MAKKVKDFTDYCNNFCGANGDCTISNKDNCIMKEGIEYILKDGLDIVQFVEPFVSDVEKAKKNYTIDEVGGYHEDGIGINPHGIYCGECSKITCSGCHNENMRVRF